ncbi:hypothetical protein EI94DRAFT_1748114 [Lactarius quietus]|nr:hypothetical protein EI94DRAFT_1748114 [Lactarius quietus]
MLCVGTPYHRGGCGSRSPDGHRLYCLIRLPYPARHCRIPCPPKLPCFPCRCSRPDWYSAWGAMSEDIEWVSLYRQE